MGRLYRACKDRFRRYSSSWRPSQPAWPEGVLHLDPPPDPDYEALQRIKLQAEWQEVLQDLRCLCHNLTARMVADQPAAERELLAAQLRATKRIYDRYHI